ncbi:hypothetical protein UT300012_32250 [Paraclostridium bifermentans]
MSYYDRFKRMNNLYGTNVAEESTSKGRIDFKDMLENDLSPTVHEVMLRVNEKEDISENKVVKVDVGNVGNNDQREFDEKYVKFAYDERVTIGSQVDWKDKTWLIVHEEEMSFDIYQNFTMKWCNNVLRHKLNGVIYEIPIVVSNLTLYSDGMSDMVYISTQDGKRNLLMSDNDLTRNINIDTRVMLTNNTVYRVTHIDDFTQKGVRNVTMIQVELHSLDDLENNIAYNNDSEMVETPTDICIGGEDIIYIGSFNEYEVLNSNESYDWNIEGNPECLTIIKHENKCIIECEGNSSYIGEKFKLQLIKDNLVIDEKIIKVRGFC